MTPQHPQDSRTDSPSPDRPDDLPGRLGALRRPLPTEVRDAVLAEVGLVDRCAAVASPVGTVLVVVGRRGIRRVLPAADPGQVAEEHRRRSGRPVRWLDPVPEELQRAVAGRPADRAAVDLGGLTPFQLDVLAATREIPPGETRSYRWVAERIGRPRAVRAVGSALAANPVPLVIPCHRVTRSDGTTGQYALGAKAKVALLAAEGVAVPARPGPS